MPITAKQREERKGHIGSSDVAAILGCDPWRNIYDLYLEKTGKLTDDNRDDMRMEAGNLLEEPVLKLASKSLGELLIGPPTRVMADCPIIRVNTDALVKGTDDPVEAKTHGLFSPSNDNDWGEEGTDQVPERVIVQCHAHMMAWGRDVCHVPVLIGHRGLCLYTVPRSRELSDLIVERVDEFWRMNVLADTPPENVQPHPAIVTRMRRIPGKVADVSPELVQRWLESKEAYSVADKARKAVELELKAALGDAEAALCGELGAVTWYESPRKGYVVEDGVQRRLTHRPKGL